MNPALAALAAVTLAGGVLAVSARDVRTVALGAFIVLLGLPLVSDPWPDPLSILIRIAATLLAIRIVAIGLRGAPVTGGSRIGWPAEALLAVAAASVGFGSHGLGAAALGPAEAQAAGFGLVVLALAPLATGRDVLRLALGALLLLAGASAIRAGLDRTPGQAEQLMDAILTIAIGGAIAVVATAARAAGGLDAIEIGGARESGRRLPDAHRIPDRPVRDGRPARAPVTPVLGTKPAPTPVAPVPNAPPVAPVPSPASPAREDRSQPEPPRRDSSGRGPAAPAAGPSSRDRVEHEPGRGPASRRTRGTSPTGTPERSGGDRPGGDRPGGDRPDGDRPSRSRPSRSRRMPPPSPEAPPSTEAEP